MHLKDKAKLNNKNRRQQLSNSMQRLWSDLSKLLEFGIYHEAAARIDESHSLMVIKLWLVRCYIKFALL